MQTDAQLSATVRRDRLTWSSSLLANTGHRTGLAVASPEAHLGYIALVPEAAYNDQQSVLAVR